MNKIYTHKKAVSSIATVLLVFMTLTLATISLYTLTLKKTEIEGKMISLASLDKIYEIEDVTESYIEQLLYQSMIETYNDMAKNNEYIFDECEEKCGYKIFCTTAPDIEKKFEKEVKEMFNEKFENITLALENEGEIDEQTRNIFKMINEKIPESKITCNENSCNFFLTLTLDYTPAEKKRTLRFLPKRKNIILEITKRKEINITIPLTFLNLVDFETIKEKIQNCLDKESTDLEDCISKNLPEFDIKILKECSDSSCKEKKQTNYYLFDLKSKRLFFVDNELKSINLKFILGKKESCEC